MTRGSALVLAVAVVLAVPTLAGAQAADVVQYYHTDAIGSVRRVTDATGQVVGQYDYRPFGEPWNTPVTPDRRQFAGKERDRETGFDYFGGRYYAGQTGRFTTVDPVLPIEDALLDPQRWNRYTYVMNRPLALTDPDGRCPQCLLLAQRLALQAAQLASRYGTQAYNWATKFFNSPAGQETLKTAAELVTGADAGPAALPTINLASKAAARAALSELGDVGAAANRFFRDATSKSTDFTITELAGGVRRLQFFSPANNPGYGKRYIQEIDEFGRILREYKETIGPDGVIEIKWVHGGPAQ